MNTIKEQSTINVTAKDAKSYEIGFKAGAGYVIKQIENVLTNPRKYVNPDKSVEEGMVDALIKCVKQLKK